ncbi:MAG: hypothetical protein ACQESQ_12455 [Bacteroidota bacterium]
MIKNKKIILPFLLLAWTIIIAHSIIPHHHHDSHHDFVCSHCYANHHQNTFTEEINEQNDCHEHACHFQIEVLRQVSIDPVFIAAPEHFFADFLAIQKSERNTFYIVARYEPLFFANHLRAPPIFV